MAVAVGDVFLLTMRGRCNLQRIITTLTYRITAWSGVSDEYNLALGMAQAFAATGLFNMETPYLGVMANNYTLDEIRAQKIRPVRYRYATVSIGNTGAFADNALSSNTSVDITMWAALAGRRYVTTKHIGPTPTAVGVYTDGLITNGYKVPMLTLRDKMLATWTSAGLGVTMQPTIAHQPPLTGDTLIADGTVQDTVRVMRRRTVGLGE